VVFGLVFVVAIAAIIISVIRSQNRVSSVFVAWTVSSSSIFWVQPLSPFFSMFIVVEVFSR